MSGASPHELDTPAIVVDADRLAQNVQDVQRQVSMAGLALRPHAKAHKIPQVALMQAAHGASGITVAKLGEAEAFADGGQTDIFVAYPLVGPHKTARAVSLARRVKLSSAVDDLGAAAALGQAFVRAGSEHDVLIKVDAGFGRVGVRAEDVLAFGQRLAQLPGLKLTGVCIHEGSTYGIPDPAQRAEEARRQCLELVQAAMGLREAGIDLPTISAGSTPGLQGDLTVQGLTELRPGNYVFYDAIQVGLGVAPVDRCALTVLTTVVSSSGRGRFIVDAGSKVFGLDRGAHGLPVTDGHGIVLGRPGLALDGLSEEHGWGTAHGVEAPRVGEVLRIVPNHACSVVNTTDHVFLASGDAITERWDVSARGAVR
jgi:D-serine deaminase-like pyridoxal phosphate-dependent protein